MVAMLSKMRKADPASPPIAPITPAPVAPVSALPIPAEPSALTQRAQVALHEAELTVRRLQAHKAAIPAQYSRAVEQADGPAMRTLARTSQDLDEDIIAARITEARARIALFKAQRQDAQALIPSAEQRAVAALEHFEAQRLALEAAETALSVARGEEQGAKSEMWRLDALMASAQRTVRTLIDESAARVL